MIGKDLIDVQKGKFRMITRFGADVTHRDAWDKCKRDDESFYRCDYEYFPRGRVWEDGSRAVLFLNSVLDTPAVVEAVKIVFETGANVAVYKDGTMPMQFAKGL